MGLFQRILFFWIASVLAFLASFLLPHSGVTTAGFIAYAVQLLAFIICVFLIKHETISKNKYIFVNFAAFFSVCVLFHLYAFVGTLIFHQSPMAQHYFFQYVCLGLYYFLLAVAVSYITVDLLFREFSILQKYIVTLAIVGGCFAYYYYPYFLDPNYLYTLREISEWKELDKASSELKSTRSDVTEEALVSHLRASNTYPLLNSLSAGELERKVSALYPYLQGSNYMILLLKPIYLNTIYMCMLSLGMILLYFGYQYRKDPPQGAYIEKIMFFLMLFCPLEAFHAWSFIKMVEWRDFAQVVAISQYLSAAVLVCGTVLFGLRLWFITSPYGEFYEHEIVEHPTGITRWRDALDNLIISHFFNRNPFVGRFFVLPRIRSKE